MKYLITILLIIVLAFSFTLYPKGDDMRAITNKMLGVKPSLNNPGLRTFSVGKSMILPIETTTITTQIKQAVIQAAVANFTQSVYTPNASVGIVYRNGEIFTYQDPQTGNYAPPPYPLP